MAEAKNLNCSGSTNVTDIAHPLPPRATWHALEAHATRLGASPVPSLFASEAQRYAELSLSHDGILVDFSKQHIDPAALGALLELARQCDLSTAIGALFAAQPLNFTERRAALHMALRGSCAVPQRDQAAMRDTSARVRAFVDGMRNGNIIGANGQPIQRVVNLGIGGSDLGPRFVVEALTRHADPRAPQIRFVANVDPLELDLVLAEADPHTTLFIISSKSFTTAETLANARAALRWLRNGLGDDADIGRHLAAVSNATSAATAFGVPGERVFQLPEWVGGRYSVWSAIGLPAMLALGSAGFEHFLAGGRSMDEHFRDTPLQHNLPVLMGLIGLWNASFMDIDSLALLPYAHALRSLPAWLQQLEMESNGKRCTRDASAVEIQTSPIIWGGSGTVGQHAFHQLFYQGTRRVALDFVVIAGGTDERERMLVDNALAQSAALMSGRDLQAAQASLRARNLPETEVERLAPHLVCPGNQPSTTILLPTLTPYTLGQLMALYEHKVFVQGWIWGINSFDQYGVELGKDMARQLASGNAENHDPSTAGLMAAVAAMRARADEQS
ncbi:MAG: glucose-6-phosphate isomerase [Rhodocyclales bacterium]|nr:glucose-6-phosphate isomerase [Rhodocyclales bacterium]